MKNKDNNKKTAGIEMISGYEVESGQVTSYLSIFGFVDLSTNLMHVSLIVGKAGKRAYMGAARAKGFDVLRPGKARTMAVDPEVYKLDAPKGSVPVCIQLKRVEPIYANIKGASCLSWRVENKHTPAGPWCAYNAHQVTVDVSNELSKSQYDLVNQFCGATVLCPADTAPEDKATSLEAMIADLQSCLAARGLKKNHEARKAAPINWGGLVTHVDVTKDEIIEVVRFTRPQRDLILKRLKDIDVACPALEDLPLRRGRLSKQESQGLVQYSSEQLECLNTLLEHTGYALIFVPEYGIYGLRHLRTGQLIELSASDIAFLRYGKECSLGGGELV